MYNLFRNILFKFDPEKIHDLTFLQAKLIQKNNFLKQKIKSHLLVEDPILKQVILGRSFVNPIGLAAGFDKNGELLPLFESLGFGFSEIGSITALASQGNPKPRLFRLPKDQAIINRMGLNNMGAKKIAQNLEKMPSKFWENFPVGINISKTHSPDIFGNDAINDFVTSYKSIKKFGHYVTVNISCPNTAEGKTFESTPEDLKKLLKELSLLKGDGKLLLKLSNKLDDSDLKKIINLSLQNKIAGLVISNTSISRNNLLTKESIIKNIGNGGLSGSPIKESSTELIKKVYQLSSGSLPIIGVGGIMNGQDAFEKILAGASLLQVLTGLIYKGPFIAKNINQELIKLLKQNGYKNIHDAIGQGAK